MNRYGHLLYKRGFLLTDKNELNILNIETKEQIEKWKKVSFMHYSVYIENSLEYTLLRRRGVTILIIGLVLNPIKNLFKQSKIAKSLIKSRVLGEVNFLDELDELSGRYTIIINYRNITKVFNDACGTRTIYYDTNDNHTYVSSHSHLIADLCDYKVSNTYTEYISGKNPGAKYLPGLLSPFEKIKLLTPNTTYCIENKEMQRYFPRENNEILTKEEAIDKLLPIMRTQSQLLDSKGPTLISVTAGMDSRLTLALHSDQKTKSKYFSHYNYDNIQPFLEDMKISEKISRELNLDFTIYGYSSKDTPEDLNELKYIWQKNVA